MRRSSGLAGSGIVDGCDGGRSSAVGIGHGRSEFERSTDSAAALHAGPWTDSGPSSQAPRARVRGAAPVAEGQKSATLGGISQVNRTLLITAPHGHFVGLRYIDTVSHWPGGYPPTGGSRG